MASPEPRRAASSVQSMVKELVDQFSDPLDFYRELIQNAIDAESNRVTVALDYADGRAVVRVEDDGTGMDEAVIDDYLLVLFRSTKDQDLTKIGKFGIGFVSVFAPRPERVQVFTAKNGQSWRLDFPSYRRYDKYRMPEPRDGTLVELTKKMTAKEYGEFAAASLARIRHWCRHADTRIFFQDKAAGAGEVAVNEPFDLEGGADLRYEEEGTEAVLAFSDKPFTGFYNRGLTLKEGSIVTWAGLQVKVKSRFLEHTLTRDNVLMDANWEKVLRIVNRLVERELPQRLKADMNRLAGRIGQDPGDARARQEWARRLPFLRWLFSGRFSRWRRSDWPLFPALHGPPLSLGQVGQAVRSSDRGRTFYFDGAANPVTEALSGRDVPVLPEGDWLQELSAWTGGAQPVKASQAHCLPRPLAERSLPAALRGLLETLRQVDARCGAKYSGLLPADFDTPASSVAGRLFVTARAPGELCTLADRPRSSLLWFGRERRWALFNVRHPFLVRLARLHRQRPGLAAYLALKAMHLSDGEVPADAGRKYCNLAEKTEGLLLSQALALDEAASAQADGGAP